MPTFADVYIPIICEHTPKPPNWHCLDLINYHHHDNDDIDLRSKYTDAINGNCPYKPCCKRYQRAVSQINLQLEFPFYK